MYSEYVLKKIMIRMLLTQDVKVFIAQALMDTPLNITSDILTMYYFILN